MYYNDDHQILRLWVARRLNSNWSQAGGLSIIVASPNINKYQKESNLYQKLSFKSDLSVIVASPNINKYQNESNDFRVFIAYDIDQLTMFPLNFFFSF